MKTQNLHEETIEAYIKTFPADTQRILQKIRNTIHSASPDAQEAIRYQMPTFRLAEKNLVHFAAYAHHIGFYPAPSGVEAFKENLKNYKTSKGAIQFPLDKPIPYDLIHSIVQFRTKETLSRYSNSSTP